MEHKHSLHSLPFHIFLLISANLYLHIKERLRRESARKGDPCNLVGIIGYKKKKKTKKKQQHPRNYEIVMRSIEGQWLTAVTGVD